MKIVRVLALCGLAACDSGLWKDHPKTIRAICYFV